MAELGFQARLNLPYEQVIEKVTKALEAEGFGVLTTIDMKEVIKKNLGIDFRKYTILGACEPQLSYQALGACLDVGLLLPCNVIVYEEGEETVINIINPLFISTFMQDPTLDSVAKEAHQRFQRVWDAIQSQM